MARILVVDDEDSMRQVLIGILERDRHETIEAATVREARTALGSSPLDLVITDQKLPDGEGLSLLAAAKGSDLSMPVIVVTGYATIDLAVEALRLGAFDFITKPFTPEVVLTAVRRAFAHTVLLRENVWLRGEVKRLGPTSQLIGNSAPMRIVREQIERMAPTDATVLIAGETGTGKELAARAIQRGSQRADQPFVAMNCAAFSETLLDSELFGHEKGAFTGADRSRKGLFEAAHGGTLLLDEAGEMSLALQAKLLRVLVDGQVMRVGSTSVRTVDVRVIVTTHRDLGRHVRERHFREDLYFRLAVLPLAIPPLRERRDDIPLLVAHFLQQVAVDLKVPRRKIQQAALDKLRRYDFPGNVRELRNLMERAYILARGPEIGPDDFPTAVEPQASTSEPDSVEHPGQSWIDGFPAKLNLRETFQTMEMGFIRRALRLADGVQAQAARSLGISRSDLAYKLKKHAIDEQEVE